MNPPCKERPDYSEDGKPISEIESRGIGQIRVLNAEEIAGMRLAGKVCYTRCLQ